MGSRVKLDAWDVQHSPVLHFKIQSCCMLTLLVCGEEEGVLSRLHVDLSDPRPLRHKKNVIDRSLFAANKVGERVTLQYIRPPDTVTLGMSLWFQVSRFCTAIFIKKVMITSRPYSSGQRANRYNLSGK